MKIDNILGSIFCFLMLWLFCKYTTLCNYPCINRRFHIVIRSELFDRIFLYHPAKTNRHAQHLMGIEGVISYVTLIPSAIFLWVKDGEFLLFNPDGIIISAWFEIMFWSELGIFLIDYWIGYYLQWHKKQNNRMAKKPEIIDQILWDGTEPQEIISQAKDVFLNCDKIIWDTDAQEYYYIQGKLLLRIDKTGVFLSLSCDADSPCVLKAIRMGNFLKL